MTIQYSTRQRGGGWPFRIEAVFDDFCMVERSQESAPRDSSLTPAKLAQAISFDEK